MKSDQNATKNFIQGYTESSIKLTKISHHTRGKLWPQAPIRE